MGGGGAPGLAHASNVAVDMSGSGLTCAEIADLPHQVFAAVGASSGPMPVVKRFDAY